MSVAIPNEAEAAEKLRLAVRDIQDFPKPGIVFKDITPILSDHELFRLMVTILVERYKKQQIDRIVVIDARGFLIGSAVAYVLGVGLALVRKKGKLPYKCIEASYSLEYGEATVEMHEDALNQGEKVIVIDDVLATGGTMAAAVELCEKIGAQVVETAFLMELSFLKGREKLNGKSAFAILEYD
ncbi:MAG: adenine phosphoribosyltransferase [Verrucomicrobiota bacterium]